jgi:hypothetical protein
MSAPIPSDVSYAIINVDEVPGSKLSLDVRLSRKVNEDELRTIAHELRRQRSGEYQRVFIVYYLPEMQVDAGGWATSHFNPELEVRIQGLSDEQEQTLRRTDVDTSREIIGRWLDDTPFVGRRISIYRSHGKLFVEQAFKDGSTMHEELMERPTATGTAYRKVHEANGDAFYVINAQGNLEIRDAEGIISTAMRL